MWRWCSRSWASGGCAIGLASLLDRRLVAPQALRRYLARGPRRSDRRGRLPGRGRAARATSWRASAAASTRFSTDGPVRASAVRDAGRRHPARCADRPPARLAARDATAGPGGVSRRCVDRLRALLPDAGRPAARRRASPAPASRRTHCASEDAWKRHRQAAAELAPAVAEAIRAFRRDLNVVHVARRLADLRRRAAAVSADARRARAARFLRRARAGGRAARRRWTSSPQSRFRLEARYRHVLVDEFQDTSRAQWELVAQLVRSWGEGLRRRRRRASRRRSSSSAIASSRSTGSGTRTSRCSTRPRRSSARLRPDGDAAPRDLGQLPRGARRCWRS